MKEIKIDKRTKEAVKTKLNTAENTLSSTVNKLIQIHDDLNGLVSNPSINTISKKTENIKEQKAHVRTKVNNIKVAIDGNLEEFIELDEKISNTFGGW